jgi:hypothetical protein
MSTSLSAPRTASPDRAPIAPPRLLARTFGHVPITGEPVDGSLVVGAVLLSVAAAGLFTDVLGLVPCGVVAVTALVLLHLSGRGATTS